MKKVLVVGGSSDIGFAVSDLLSKDYEVISTFYKSERKSDSFKTIYCNIISMDSIDTLFESIGKVDYIITASFPFILSDPLDFEQFRKVHKFLKGHIYLITKAKKYLTLGGKIVNLLGQSVDYGLPSAPHYGASFSYLDNFSKSVNADLGRRGVLSICNILMGPVDTKLWDGVSLEDREKFEKRVVSFIEPTQVAKEVKHILESKVVPTKYILDGFYSLP